MEEPSGDNEDGEETETEATANNQRTRPIASKKASTLMRSYGQTLIKISHTTAAAATPRSKKPPSFVCQPSCGRCNSCSCR